MLLDVKSYGIAFGTRVILADINFSIDMEKGIVVVMGPGGTGKSTLLRSLAGINKRSSNANSWGEILYQDQPIDDNNVPVLIQQNAKAMGQPVIECLSEALRKVFNEPKTVPELRSHIIEELEKLEMHSMIPYLDEPMIQLPIEYARAANILRETFTQQPLLLLDEPTTKMTEKGANLLLELIKNISKERVCITILHHQKQTQEIADKVMLLAGGRIQAFESKDDFFKNKNQNEVVAQFLRSGSCFIPAPDADIDALDESAVKPPPLPEAAIEVLSKVKEKQKNEQLATLKNEKPAEPITTPAKVPNEVVDPVLMSGANSVTANLARKPTSRSRFVGPNGFHWIVPEQLAGCPMPGIVAPLEYDLSALRDVGITTLVNLTERELPEQTLKQYGIKSIQFKIEDRRAPPVMWIKMLLVQIDKLLAEGEVLGVHCLAGLGRTGTILGAWLIKKGLTAEEALKRLRQIDAGYVQSKEQEDLLYSLEDNILIRATSE